MSLQEQDLMNSQSNTMVQQTRPSGSGAPTGLPPAPSSESFITTQPTLGGPDAATAVSSVSLIKILFSGILIQKI